MLTVLGAVALLVTCVAPSQRNVQFQADPDFTDKLCSTELSATTWSFPSPRSDIDCATRCSLQVGCRGVFYNHRNATCIGGSEVINDTQCQDDVGSIYFKINAVPFQAACDGAVSCAGENMACWDGKCVCMPGYSLVPSRSLCVTDCSEANAGLGSTFQVYLRMRMKALNLDVFKNLTLAECKDRCVSWVWDEGPCLGFEFHTNFGQCNINRGSPLTHPANLEAGKPNEELHHRNCE